MSSAADDEADTTYSPAYVRSANASGAPPAALAPLDDTTKSSAKGGTANALADAQKRFSDLLARLDAASPKTTDASAAKPTERAPASSSEPASTAAARVKTVIGAYAATYATDRTATFSV